MSLARDRILITGHGAICGSGQTPDEIWGHLRAGTSAMDRIRAWDASNCPAPIAAEIHDFDPRALVPDRKVHKLIQRSDVLGLYAADHAIAAAGLMSYRDTLDSSAADVFNERTGIYVGSGGGTYASNYEFLPLLTTAAGDLRTFGHALSETVNPMWLLRTLPNNVLCHLGIRYGFKGPNTCITNHAVSGTLAILEAAETLRADEADRAIAVGHHAGIEPQASLYYASVGLLAPDVLRPFDACRSGSLHGEGAAALVLERDTALTTQSASVLGEFLGGACTTEGEGLLNARADGDGLIRAMTLALAAAGVAPRDIGCIVAHGNGTRVSDASEATAIRQVFGPTPPPVTAFKWAFGHLTAAAGIMDTVLALVSLRRRELPGIATLSALDPECAPLPVSREVQVPRSDLALVLSRGFAGTNAVLVLRAADRTQR